MKWLCYYIWLFLCSGAITGINMYFGFSFSAHKCTPPVSTNTTGTEYKTRHSGNGQDQDELGDVFRRPSFNNATATGTSSTNTTTSNPLTTMPKLMGFCYAAITGLIFLYMLVFFYFKRREDADPNKLAGEGCCYKFYGIIIRVFPILCKLAHYVILIFIIIQASNAFLGSDCDKPYYLDQYGAKNDSQVVQFAKWGVFISLWFWIMLHIVFPGWRKALYDVFFQYEPYDPSRNVVWAYLFIYWGPN